MAEKREIKTTEFWTVVVAVVLWLLDRHTGTNLLEGLTPETLTEARAQVIAIAADLRAQAGSSDLVLWSALAVYGLRKAEKMLKAWRG